MLRDNAYKYFIECDNNCAETTLRCIRDAYGLDISEDDIKLVSGFGAGCGCGALCGVVAGCLAAYGKMTVNGRAHATDGFGPSCGEFFHKFEEELGSTVCEDLKKKYRNDEVRCLKTVELGLDCFEKFAEEKGLKKA